MNCDESNFGRYENSERSESNDIYTDDSNNDEEYD